jgi:hypothetical protein
LHDDRCAAIVFSGRCCGLHLRNGECAMRWASRGGARCRRCCVKVWRGSVQRALNGWPLETRYDSDGGQQQNGDCNGNKDAVHFSLSSRGHPSLRRTDLSFHATRVSAAYNERVTWTILVAVIPPRKKSSHPERPRAACGQSSRGKRPARQTSGPRPSRDAADW